MFYGSYRNLRNGAWQCLIDCQINHLPIDILQIARTADIRVIRNSLVADLQPGEQGKSYFNGSHWFIIYDDSLPTVEARFTIAHELGHIFLGHDLTYAKFSSAKEFESSDKSEQQADMFAIRLLCPACLLWSLELHSAEQISEVCRIPLWVAEPRAKRMKTLLRRNCFLKDPLEQRLYEGFKPFVAEYLEKQTLQEQNPDNSSLKATTN